MIAILLLYLSKLFFEYLRFVELLKPKAVVIENVRGILTRDKGYAKDRIENLYSQDLIKWKIIEWGIENKMKYYDLAGFNPNPISKKEEGIIQFKKKWGGQIHQYYRILDQPSNYTKIIRKIN